MSEGKEWVHRICFNAYFEDALTKYRAKTGFGSTFAILYSLNEYWFQIGVMSHEGYEYNKKRYGLILTEKLKKEIEAQEKTQHSEKPIAVLKPKHRLDYSKMSLEDLQKRLNHLREIGDVTEIQHVAFEIKKRLMEKGVKA